MVLKVLTALKVLLFFLHKYLVNSLEVLPSSHIFISIFVSYETCEGDV